MINLKRTKPHLYQPIIFSPEALSSATNELFHIYERQQQRMKKNAHKNPISFRYIVHSAHNTVHPKKAEKSPLAVVCIRVFFDT